MIKIENEAFLDCTNLKTIDIPDSVTILGVAAFSGCNNLDVFICRSTSEPEIEFYSWHDDAFRLNHNNFESIEKATLYVPEEVIDAYRMTKPWSGFNAVLPLYFQKLKL